MCSLKVQQQLYRNWTASDDAASARKRSEDLGLECGGDVQRLNLSYYRRYVYRMFGSSEWMHTVIALGQIPAYFVEIMREVCERRRALASAQGNTLVPRQLKRASRSGPEDGLHHQTSQAKVLRDAAKRLDKKIFHEEQLWQQGKSRMRRHEWEQLLQSRGAAWDKAEEVSTQAGFRFKDRHGDWVNNVRTDMVYLSLVEWCKQRDIVYITPAR